MTAAGKCAERLEGVLTGQDGLDADSMRNVVVMVRPCACHQHSGVLAGLTGQHLKLLQGMDKLVHEVTHASSAKLLDR